MVRKKVGMFEFYYEVCMLCGNDVATRFASKTRDPYHVSCMTFMGFDTYSPVTAAVKGSRPPMARRPQAYQSPPPWKVGQAFWTETGDAAYVLEGVKTVSALDCALVGASPELRDGLTAMIEAFDHGPLTAIQFEAIYQARGAINKAYGDASCQLCGEYTDHVHRLCAICGDELPSVPPGRLARLQLYHVSCRQFMGFDTLSDKGYRKAGALRHLDEVLNLMTAERQVLAEVSVIPDLERVTDSLGEARDHVDHAIVEIGYFDKTPAELRKLKGPLHELWAALLQASQDLSNLLDD